MPKGRKTRPDNSVLEQLPIEPISNCGGILGLQGNISPLMLTIAAASLVPVTGSLHCF